MDNTQLREELLVQADTAYFVLVSEVDILFNAAHIFDASRCIGSKSDNLKSEQLIVVLRDLGNLMKMVGAQVELWKREEEGMLSRVGVETQFLNELKATIEVLKMFFERESIDIPHFSLSMVNQAYSELVRCNKLL